MPARVAAAYAFVDEHIATTRGFRFPVTMTPDVQAPSGMDFQIHHAAMTGKLDHLLGLCRVVWGIISQLVLIPIWTRA